MGKIIKFPARRKNIDVRHGEHSAATDVFSNKYAVGVLTLAYGGVTYLFGDMAVDFAMHSGKYLMPEYQDSVLAGSLASMAILGGYLTTMVPYKYFKNRKIS